MQPAQSVMGKEPFRLDTGSSSSSSELVTSQAINPSPQPITKAPQNADEYNLQDSTRAKLYSSPAQQLPSTGTSATVAADWLIRDARETTTPTTFEHHIRTSKQSADSLVRLNQMLHKTANASFTAATPAARLQAPETSDVGLANGVDESNGFGDLIVRYVDLSLVRNMIAQYIIELVIISVILIYLFYYFRRISQVSFVTTSKTSLEPYLNTS